MDREPYKTGSGATDGEPPPQQLTRQLGWVQRLLFGGNSDTRKILQQAFPASLIYLCCLAAQWASVAVGNLPPEPAVLMSAVIAVGGLGFHVVVRMGWSQGWRDVTLVRPQMVWAMGAVAVAYQVNWQARAILPMVAALVLVFGAFRTPPSWCRQMGWVAAFLIGTSMAVGMWREPERFPLQLELFYLAFVLTVLPTVALLVGQLSQLRLERREQRRELHEALALVQRLAMQDELTGLPNRRHMQQWMAQALAREQRSGEPLAVALIDLDRFKRINDVHGHETGDQALSIFAHQARSIVREPDMLARWGGEEFLLGMPDTRPEAALLALERLKDRLLDHRAWAACPQAMVTFSAGLTQALPGQGLEQLLGRADAALYEAKRQGRNRIVLA